MKNIQIVATGPELIRDGIRSIQSVLEEIVQSARNEIQIATYLIAPSAMPFLDLIELKAQLGIKITLIINQFPGQDEKILHWINSMQNKFTHFKIFDFSLYREYNLHAKVIVVDRNKAVTGSANLSWGGMISNYEVGIYVDGEPAWQLGKMLDSIVKMCC